MSYIVQFRGKPACPCQVAWLPVFEQELKDLGVLKKDESLHIYQLIGGAPQSGGTHTRGGASDFLDLPGEVDIEIARQMGADATWERHYNWDGRGGIAHVHSVLRDCPHNEPARYQIDAVDDDYNGLGKGGQGARDDGPRPLSGRSWHEGIEWAKARQEARRSTRVSKARQLLKDALAKSKGKRAKKLRDALAAAPTR